MFCLFVIGMGILSYGLAAYQIFPGLKEDKLTENCNEEAVVEEEQASSTNQETENNNEEAEVEEVQAATTNQEQESGASGSGMNAISSNTMGPQVLASPQSMDMNISECDSMKFNFNRMQDFDPEPVEPGAASSNHKLEADEKVKATVTMNVVKSS